MSGTVDRLLNSLLLFFPLFAAIGGPTGEILETNAQVLSQISTNLSTMQVLCVYFKMTPGDTASSIYFRIMLFFFHFIITSTISFQFYSSLGSLSFFADTG
jgi:hypothetical protein